MKEYAAWKRVEAAQKQAEEMGVKLDIHNVEGWVVQVRHFKGAKLDKCGDTLEELEAFLSGMSWGLRYAKFKMSGEE
jgi:hypothetical protein